MSVGATNEQPPAAPRCEFTPPRGTQRRQPQAWGHSNSASASKRGTSRDLRPLRRRGRCDPCRRCRREFSGSSRIRVGQVDRIARPLGARAGRAGQSAFGKRGGGIGTERASQSLPARVRRPFAASSNGCFQDPYRLAPPAADVDRITGRAAGHSRHWDAEIRIERAVDEVGLGPAFAFATRTSCREGSASASRWPVRSSSSRKCCSWTSQLRRSTHRAGEC